MARSAASTGLALLTIALAATGAFAQCSWGYGAGYGSYGYGAVGANGAFQGVGYGYGYGGYGCSTPAQGASTTNYGNLRGVGPYANCQGTFTVKGADAVTVPTDANGGFTTKAYTDIGLLVFNYTATSSPSCTDLFTGLPMPFPMAAAVPTSGNFTVSAATAITAVSRLGFTNGMLGGPLDQRDMAYDLLYNSSFGQSTVARPFQRDFNPFAGLQSTNIFASSYNGAMMGSDAQALGFITVGANYLVAVGATSNITLAAGAVTTAMYTSPFVLTNATQVATVLTNARTLLAPQATTTLTSLSDVATAMAAGATIIRDIINSFVMRAMAPGSTVDVVDRVVKLSQVSWVQQSLLVAAVKTQLAAGATGNSLVAFSTPAAIQALMPTATLNYDNIYKALGLAAQGTPASLTVTLTVAGALKNCAGNFTSKWTAISKTLTTANNGSVVLTSPAAGTLLFGDMSGNTCVDAATNTKQKFIYGGVVPAAAAVRLTPLSAMTIFRQMDRLQTSSSPATFTADLYNDVYAMHGYNATKYGVNFMDFSGANFKGGALPVSVSAMNLQLQAIFAIGTSLLTGLNATWVGKPNVVPYQLIQNQYYLASYVWKGKPQFFNATAIGLVLNATYTNLNRTAGKSQDLSANRRRALLQTAAASTTVDASLINALIDTISATLASSNAKLEEVRSEAITAADLAAAGTPNASYTSDVALQQLVQAAKVAKVQQEQLAADVQTIANQAAAGQLTAAQLTTALTNLAQQYSAANLDSKIAAAVVDESALREANGQTPAASDSKSLAIPLGVGIGVGLPALIALVAGAWYIHQRRVAQGINPASQPLVGRPMGESVEAVVAVTTAFISATDRV